MTASRSYTDKGPHVVALVALIAHTDAGEQTRGVDAGTVRETLDYIRQRLRLPRSELISLDELPRRATAGVLARCAHPLNQLSELEPQVATALRWKLPSPCSAT